MARSTLHKWIKHYNNSGSFKAKDNRTDKEEAPDVIVSDLTYVNVKGKWNYICLIIDLFNR